MSGNLYNIFVSKQLNKTRIFVFLFALFFVLSSVTYATTSKVALSDLEKDYLGKNPEIAIGVYNNNPPYGYISECGKLSGIDVSFVNIINQRVPHAVKAVPIDIHNTTDNLAYDAVMGATIENSNYVQTNPYLSTMHILVTRKSTLLENITQPVFALESNNICKTLLSERYTGSRFTIMFDIKTMVDALNSGEIDGFTTNIRVLNYYLQTHPHSDLLVVDKLHDHAIVINVKKSETILLSILNKIIATISEEERQSILDICKQEDSYKNIITLEEKIWLDEHKNIKLGVENDLLPYEGLDANGNLVGISSDFVKWFENLFDIKMKAQNNNQNNKQLHEALKNKEIDLISLSVKNSNINEGIVFSDPYVRQSLVIFTQINYKFITGLDSLYGAKVGVSESFSGEHILKTQYPDINVVTFENDNEALLELSNGNIDAFFSSLDSNNKLIEILDIKNIKVGATSPYASEIVFAIRSDMPELLSIINKGIRVMPQAKYQEIYSTWLNAKSVVVFDWLLFIKLSLILLFLTVFIVAFQTRARRKLLCEVNERKKIEEQLHEQLAFSQSILDSSPIGIGISVGNTVVYANTQTKFLTRVEVGGNYYDKNFSEEDLRSVSALMLKHGNVIDHTITIYDEAGNEFYLLSSFYKITYQGQDATLAWFINNTNQMLLQKELIRAKQEAESATLTKSEFLANMSHEIRTPMHGILGLTNLCLQEEKLSPRVHDYLTKIELSGKNLLGIINDILDLSKIEAGKMNLENIAFSLESILEKVSLPLGIALEKKNIELIFQVADDVPKQMIGDALRLNQILLNLANNAVKFTHSGEILVSVNKLLEIDSEIKLEFIIRDTGIGLTTEQVDKLFTSFSQADSSITRKYGGTGLGLAISKYLVELMQGNIWVESVYGIGSSFHFTCVFGKVDKDIELNICYNLADKSALIVDDNAMSRNILQESLKNVFSSTVLAANGYEALEHYQESLETKNYFDLVILDWKMEGIDGIETAKRIRKIMEPEHQSLLILISSYDRDSIVPKAKENDIQIILTKPVTQSSLQDAISKLFVAKKSEANNKDKEQNLEESFSGFYILLVEDNEINQLIAYELLSFRDINVDIASNGLEAVKLASQNSYDLVLMDIQMPEMDGFSATEILIKRGYKVPIIAMTAHAMAGDREKSLLVGMKDHIVKPIDPDILFECITKYVTKEK